MGEEDKPKNPLDVFWDQLGDKEKKHVRSYRSSKRDLQDKKGDADNARHPSSNSRKRRD